jgi:hypothetical protein
MINRRDFLKLLAAGGVGGFFNQFDRFNPAVQRIHLFDTFVAGYYYHQGTLPEVASLLTPGTTLALVRESDNPHDSQAIAIYTQQGHMIGYIPRTANEIPARIADQGVNLGAEILFFDQDAFENYSYWECLKVRVFEVITIPPNVK